MYLKVLNFAMIFAKIKTIKNFQKSHFLACQLSKAQACLLEPENAVYLLGDTFFTIIWEDINIKTYFFPSFSIMYFLILVLPFLISVIILNSVVYVL